MVKAIEQLRRILARMAGSWWVMRPASLACTLVLAMAGPVLAQDQPAPALDDLPQVRHLAAALSDPDSRLDTLLTMVTVAQLLENLALLEPSGLEAASEEFRNNRAWLDRLATRYVEIPMRSTVFDPASWLIVRKLHQY
ncbi:MAG: hypothetical protein R3212_10435, partial [Xanthomonadales bacterium]|nr:hypothetical protein [Xanthomonadales bacterium]